MKLHTFEVVLRLPGWMEDFLSNSKETFSSIEERMQFVITLARMNIEHKTGGPFGAAIFDLKDGRLIAVGVNQVEKINCSIVHAEILAIALAQKKIGHYDLGAKADMSYELVTSTEPCVMCLGAIVWSGVRQVVCAARDEDARAIGFDEGPKPENWAQSLEDRGIAVVKDVLREDAKAVLNDYNKTGGLIYNSRQEQS
ncbi:MAG: nucleoside deaminase [Sedimentisphaerales bacterium]|nr:nucleoside deaminase [Sedimentisphaerales bacterium]